MTEPKPDKPVHEDLDLDAETVGDLEPSDREADELRGGGVTVTPDSKIGCCLKRN
jgi:hypothetical protein